MTDLDLVTIGRASVDLYGQQTGGSLEDMSSFAKAVGGCPANIAIGASRLGLATALVTRVGGEHMGRFIIQQLEREGVSTAGVKVDPDRLTALVLLGVCDQHTLPLIFYRANCADAALCSADIDDALIASARALLVTGTHFSRENSAAAQHKAMRIARAHGRETSIRGTPALFPTHRRAGRHASSAAFATMQIHAAPHAPTSPLRSRAGHHDAAGGNRRMRQRHRPSAEPETGRMPIAQPADAG